MKTRSERGMTLVELLVAVSITGIISGALFGAILMGFRTVDNSNQRLAGANDTQLVASYFTGDVASAEAISLTGTTSHVSPSVTATANNELLTLTTMKTATSATPPAGMSEAWDRTSTGITIEMADASVGAGATGQRITTSTAPTSSITHTIALQPVGTISRHGVDWKQTPGATSLTIAKPPNTLVNDVMITQLAVAGGANATVTAPSGWTLVDSRDSAGAFKSLVYTKLATDALITSFTWTFDSAREAVGAIASYVNVATSVSTKANAINPCGGDTPVLSLTWTDHATSPGVVNTVTYGFEQLEKENRLVRHHCTGASTDSDGDHTLARVLASSNAVSAACQPASCSPLPVIVTLSLTEPALQHEDAGRTYQVSAATRTG